MLHYACCSHIRATSYLVLQTHNTNEILSGGDRPWVYASGRAAVPAAPRIRCFCSRRQLNARPGVRCVRVLFDCACLVHAIFVVVVVVADIAGMQWGLL